MKVDGNAIVSDKRTNLSNDIPLPPGWTRGFSESQQKYYYCHPPSDHTQWHPLTATEARDPAMAKNRLQQATATATATVVAKTTRMGRRE
jgi:hypothetical protein